MLTPPQSISDTPRGEILRTRARMHELRVRWMLRVGAAIAGIASGAWVILFAMAGAWTAAAMDALGVACAVGALVLERRDCLRLASGMLLATLFAIVFMSAAFLDVPTAAAGRAMHQCFLPLAAGACLLMRDERAWIRHGSIGACLLAYSFFAGFDPRWHTAYSVPDAIRVPGTWLDLCIAMIGLYFALQVLQADVEERHSIEDAIRDGLLRAEMQLFYQPQVDDAGLVVGAEALLRWQHATRGMVSPGEFLPAAEAAGLMPMLGDWVLVTACEQLAQWQKNDALAGLRVAINVSASQFADPGFEQRVVSTLAQTGARPDRLKIELTESTLARDLEGVAATMASLRKHGVGFSLDDFGTGFSSLSYLRRLPLEQLKIDQSFVRQMSASDEDRAIVRTVVALARDLHLDVIAEGVETEEHRLMLREMGCDVYQGYLFSRALPAREFARFAQRAGAANCQISQDVVFASPDARAVPAQSKTSLEPAQSA